MTRYQWLNWICALLLAALLAWDVYSNISWIWYAALLLVYMDACCLGSFLLSWEFYMNVSSRGESTGAIAITFDDGPVGSTQRVLEILARNNVKATFFCIGDRAVAQPDLLKEIDRNGHLIGNHSYYHRPSFGFQSRAKVLEELVRTNEVIGNILNRRPRFFRPPYGVTNPMIASAATEGDFLTVGWSVRSFDTIIHDAARLYKRVTNGLKPGDIVLFHDYCESTIAILPAFIEHVRNQGLELVRLDELLNENAYR